MPDVSFVGRQSKRETNFTCKVRAVDFIRYMKKILSLAADDSVL